MSQYDYVLLPRLEVRNANASATFWALSPEVVMATRQMAHALARRLDATEDEAGVAIVHHHVEMLGEKLPKDRFFRPQQRRGAVFINKADYPSGQGKSATLSMQPTASMHLRISVVLRFEAGAVLEQSDIEDFLRGGRLAGGQIIDHGPIETFDSEAELRKRLKSGFLVFERSDLLQPAQDEQDLFDAMFRATARWPKPEGHSRANEGSADDTAWVVPATLGYAAITPFEHRDGARGGYPAAYVEPLVGLIQYRSIRQAADASLPFWDYWRPDDTTFLIRQTTA